MSEQHVFVYADQPVNEVQMRGGKGKGLQRKLLNRETVPAGSPFGGASVTMLPPGASVGVHRHEGDAEVYVLIRGSGLYTGRDGKQVRLNQGDLAFCYDGEIHGLENDTDEPLIMAGIIAR